MVGVRVDLRFVVWVKQRPTCLHDALHVGKRHGCDSLAARIRLQCITRTREPALGSCVQRRPRLKLDYVGRCHARLDACCNARCS
jgi:hypothetical protein